MSFIILGAAFVIAYGDLHTKNERPLIYNSKMNSDHFDPMNP